MNHHKYTNLIQINAESIGIKTLDNEIIDFLNIEIEEKVKAILSQAKKFMRVSKRKTLKVDDLNHSLKFYNFNPLFGYDSYANAEYERIESVNGLWRPKQNIIDLEDYLSKPIVSCPMQVFPHFHWISIEGKRPNIPENFIRDEYKPLIETNIGMVPMESSLNQNIKINNQVNINIINLNDKRGANNSNVIPPVIHNISKELQIFLENFEQRLRKEIKINKLNPNPLYLMSKELQISLNVIENEPGVVELLPYIIEFLMNTLENKQYIKDPKVHMVILEYIQAIIKNPFFYLEPYLHQVVSLVLSLILMENSSSLVDLVITVKDLAVRILKKIFIIYEIKYPNFINQLLDIFKSNIVPNNTNPNFLTAYGAIKSINTLGPIHAINIILPQIENIITRLQMEKVEKFEKDSNKSFEDKIISASQDNKMILDQPPSQANPSFPKITFTMPLVFGNAPITSSIFSEISNTNVVNYKKDSKLNEEIDNLLSIKLMKNKKIPCHMTKKTSYLYYALKESVIIILNYSLNFDNEYSTSIFTKMNDIFGEDLIQNFLQELKLNSNVGLDLFI